MDGTKDFQGCKSSLFGDLTCPGKRFEVFKTGTDKLTKICKHHLKPKSDALLAASGWDKSDKSCVVGIENDVYIFEVENAEEILKGKKAKVRELEPIELVKHTENFSTDENLWNEQGMAEWYEKAVYVLKDKKDKARLEKRVIVPNPLMFGVFGPYNDQEGAKEVPAEVYFFVNYAIRAYQTLFLRFKEGPSSFGLPDALSGALFKFMAAYNRVFDPEAFLVLQYRSSYVSRLLGRKLTEKEATPSENETKEPLDFGDFKGIFPTKEFAELLLKFTPSKAKNVFWFFPFQLKCHEREENEGCNRKHVDIEPLLTEDEAKAIIRLATDPRFAKSLDKTESAASKKSQELQSDALRKFLSTCSLNLGERVIVLNEEKCQMVQKQLLRAGQFALRQMQEFTFIKYVRQYGFEGPDIAQGRKLVPYFYKPKISELLGDFKDPITNRTLSYNFMTVKNDPSSITGTYVHSKFGEKGLGYFYKSGGQTESCLFDKNCMSQDVFKETKNCVEGLNGCVTNKAKGFGSKTIPGVLFGTGTNSYHQKGASLKMFVPNFFGLAEMTNVQIDKTWKGVLVDHWAMTDLLSLRDKTCNLTAPVRLENGSWRKFNDLDCTSPRFTANIGWFRSPLPDKFSTNVYASLPHFTELDLKNEKSHNENFKGSPYKAGDRVDVAACVHHRDCQEKNYKSFFYVEPQMGRTIKGSQKFQINLRIQRNDYSDVLTAIREEEGGGGFNDFLLPLLWIHEHRTAKDHQIATLKKFQEIPNTIETFSFIALWLGLVFSILSFCFFGKFRQWIDPFTTITKSNE